MWGRGTEQASQYTGRLWLRKASGAAVFHVKPEMRAAEGGLAARAARRALGPHIGWWPLGPRNAARCAASDGHGGPRLPRARPRTDASAAGLAWLATGTSTGSPPAWQHGPTFEDLSPNPPPDRLRSQRQPHGECLLRFRSTPGSGQLAQQMRRRRALAGGTCAGALGLLPARPACARDASRSVKDGAGIPPHGIVRNVTRDAGL